MSYPLAFFNGQFLPYADIAFVPDDAGIVWGATVTDRLRTFGGRPFALDAHLRRFRQSCNLARVPQPIADGKLGRVTEQLVRENHGGGELSVVWVATPGPLPGAAPIDFAEMTPSLLAYTLPLDPTRFARHYRDGFRLIPVAAPLGVDPRVKHRSRLPWWIARQEVQALDPDAEPLVIDLPSETVLETPSANLLAVVDGVVMSPPRDRVLNGVSLSVVEELCGQLGIPFARAPLTLTDLARATEVLLASTPYCVAGVSKLGGQDVPFPGPIRDRLLDAWSGLVGVNVRAQMGPQ